MENFDNLDCEILSEDCNNYETAFKIIVIGDSFVGKSCLTNKATKNLFEDTYSATIGFEYISSHVRINDKVCKIQIWDTCGQEVYRSLITGFYRASSLAILVYSIDNYESFQNLELWLKELKTYSSPDTKVILVGNKSDLSKRVVTKEMGEQYKEEMKLDLFMETSAKTGSNCKELLINVAKLTYLDFLKFKDQRSNSVESSGIVRKVSLRNEITPQIEEPKKEGCSC